MNRKSNFIDTITIICFLLVVTMSLCACAVSKNGENTQQWTSEAFDDLDPYAINEKAGVKALSYDLDNKCFSNKYIPNELLAKTKQDVGNIIFFSSSWERNKYTDGSLIFTESLELEFRDCRTGSMIAKEYYQTYAPQTISSHIEKGTMPVSETEVKGWVSTTIHNKYAILRETLEAAEDEKHRALKAAQEANLNFPAYCSKRELYRYLTDPENSFIIQLRGNLSIIHKIYYPGINQEKPFSEEAAQYAIDNLDADYKSNALEKASQDHKNTRYDVCYHLTLTWGYTEEEANYAVENADFSLNALHKAEEYSDKMPKKEIYNKLIEEQFTEEEAKYAIDNLES